MCPLSNITVTLMRRGTFEHVQTQVHDDGGELGILSYEREPQTLPRNHEMLERDKDGSCLKATGGVWSC